MCLLQNLSYDADNTSSVWTVNVIEKKGKGKKSDHLSNAIVFERMATQSMKQWSVHHVYNIC